MIIIIFKVKIFLKLTNLTIFKSLINFGELNYL